MDLIIGRGLRFSSLLLRTTSTFLPATSQAPFAFIDRPKEAKCHRVPRFFGKFSNFSLLSSNYLSFTNQVSSRNRILFEQDVFQNRIMFAGFSEDSKAENLNKVCDKPSKPEAKPTMFQKMKQMAKDYWYILIPIHIVTSIGWITTFYIAAKNGVDITAMLEWLNLNESYIEMMRNSNAGHLAVTYALYKVFTPARYTVTIGGTTLGIKYLNKWGYLKFKMPEKAQQSAACGTKHEAKCNKPSEPKKTEPPKP